MYTCKRFMWHHTGTGHQSLFSNRVDIHFSVISVHQILWMMFFIHTYSKSMYIRISELESVSFFTTRPLRPLHDLREEMRKPPSTILLRKAVCFIGYLWQWSSVSFHQSKVELPVWLRHCLKRHIVLSQSSSMTSTPLLAVRCRGIISTLYLSQNQKPPLNKRMTRPSETLWWDEMSCSEIVNYREH